MELGAHIGDIARKLLGKPNRAQSTRHQLRFGRNGSVAVEIAGAKRGSWFDHENGVGGGPWELLRIVGYLDDAAIADWLERELGIRRDDAFIVTSYAYEDEQGKLLFEVCRLSPKRFLQRRPDGKGGWEWKGGHSQVLYRLPKLVAAANKRNGYPPRVYVVEGEKDSDRLAQWGLTATTNPGGAGKWRSEFNRYFTGCDIVILGDNDEAGRAHVATVAANLAPVAASVRIPVLGGLEDKGDISDWIAKGGTQSDLETLVETSPPFQANGHDADQSGEQPAPGIAIHDAGDIDPTKIPPRGFLLGVTFCRKFISGLIAEGGAGKTAIRYAQYLAAATGKRITGEHVHVRSRVLIVCLEDSLDEVRRRIGAAMLHHGVSPADVRGWLFYCTPKGLKLLQTDPRGIRTIGELHSELKATVAALKIDLVGIDPFVKAHGVEENDNNAIDQVCIMLAEISDEFDCAFDIVSHARKGQATPGDAERERGASAKKDAGRLMRTVTGMTAEEAELYSVNSADRTAMVRVDDAKVNLTARSDKAMWFKLVGVALGNPTPTYPNGDTVHTVERWHPPDAFAKLTATTISSILDKLEAGPYEAGRYSPAANAKDRAAWPLIKEFCPDLSEKQAKHVIATWLKNGVLVKKDHPDPKSRRDQASLFVGKRPGDAWDS